MSKAIRSWFLMFNISFLDLSFSAYITVSGKKQAGSASYTPPVNFLSYSVLRAGTIHVRESPATVWAASRPA